MTSLDPTPAADLSALAGTWTLDPDKTTVAFRTKAMWILPVKGSFKATEGGGTVTADGTIAGTLVLDAASVNTGNKKRDAHLLTAEFFEVASYPTITYTVTGASSAGGGKANVQGTLTVHGQTRPLDLVATVTPSGDTATVTTQVDVDRSKWGVSWAKMGAGLANTVEVSATFHKA